MPASLAPLCREIFDAQQLVTSCPPKLRDRNKKVVYRIACPAGSTHQGQLVFTRWPELPLPEHFPAAGPKTACEPREDVFGYEPALPDSRTVEWYLNFAHHDLFCAYGGALLAQDEMQVAEHPALASLREALLHSSTSKPATVENGQPTPVLIRGVERRCAIATDRNELEGRPFGLYGNLFSSAKADVVERATRIIQPPTITNLIAIEAPSYGSGVYSQSEIEYILRTAYSGFHAATLESAQASGSAGAVVAIHTGFWGCGAYGRNRILMALVQVLAAQVAGVDRLVFHTFDSSGSEAYAIAAATLDRVCASSDELVEAMAVVSKIHALGLRWGTSDGN